jgi:hypothetical protein
LAAVISYLASEVLEIATEFCIDDCRRRITNRDILKSFKSDLELEALTKDIIVPEAGIIPQVVSHPLPNDGNNASTQNKENDNQELAVSVEKMNIE